MVRLLPVGRQFLVLAVGQRASENKECPSYTVRGLIISGDPIPTSAAARAALADSKSAQSLSSADNKVSQVPCTSVKSSTPMSDSSDAPPPTLEKSSNSLSGSSNVSLDSSPRHKTPSRRDFVHRRAGERIVERHGAKPNDALTRDEKSSLDWAKSLLARLKGSNPPAGVVRPAAEALKRQRSEEETLSFMSNDQPTKRQKQAQTIVIKGSAQGGKRQGRRSRWF